MILGIGRNIIITGCSGLVCTIKIKVSSIDSFLENFPLETPDETSLWLEYAACLCCLLSLFVVGKICYFSVGGRESLVPCGLCLSGSARDSDVDQFFWWWFVLIMFVDSLILEEKNSLSCGVHGSTGFRSQLLWLCVVSYWWYREEDGHFSFANSCMNENIEQLGFKLDHSSMHRRERVRKKEGLTTKKPYAFEVHNENELLVKAKDGPSVLTTAA
ncbi:hypothetical protein L6164_012598 [Bauhinia variegata]|uniref:Uncharacterized protein n=1 Tax=Bauhinia variegata TaxID=167791 RepID=A0ACB9PC19_BAUVA|nr:hypothetical protein L6164_012598 [Bauhinia variegata]